MKEKKQPKPYNPKLPKWKDTSKKEIKENSIKAYKDKLGFEESKIINYKSIKEYFIKEKGKVFVVKNNKTQNKKSLLGTLCIIDDNLYKIRGIESLGSEIISKGQEIGLLV